MGAVEEIRIALPTEVAAIVRQAVDAGEFASSSEMVGAALLAWSRRRSLREREVGDLRQAWQAALEDNTPGVSAEDVLSRLERRYASVGESTRSSK